MSEKPPSDKTVIAFRNPAGEPIVVPDAVAYEADRAYRCYQMRVQQKSWKEIALAEGYPSPEAAFSDTNRYMAEARALMTAHSQQELLQLEVARLDALGAAFWEMATKDHNIAAGKFVLDVIKTRLDATQDKKETQIAAGHTTVVVPVKSEDYLSTLQEISVGHGSPDLPSPE